MSQSEDADIVDLTASPSDKDDKKDGPGNKPAAKKLKQLRLPFAPIQKNLDKSEPVKTAGKPVKKTEEEVDASAKKKRKHSEEDEEPNKKPALEEQGNLGPRRGRGVSHK